MKPLVIYHADCTDGFGAAFAAWLKLGDEAEYLPMQYKQRYADEDISSPEDREVYILDFSFPRILMEDIFKRAKRVVWLDHHKTAFEMWCDEEDKGVRHYTETGNGHSIHLHQEKSGALLAWEWFHPGTEVPMLIRHIDDRDRWQFKLEGSKELHAALASMKPWSFEQWRDQFCSVDGFVWHHINGQVLTQGSAILRAQDAHVKSMLKQARRCELQFNFHDEPQDHPRKAKGLALNTPMHMSEIGHAIATASGSYGLVWYLSADNRAKCSLRSNDDYDVSAIARAFGGGGHKNAAGFETDIKTLMGWLK